MSYEHSRSFHTSVESERRDRDRRTLRPDETLSPLERHRLAILLAVVGLLVVAGIGWLVNLDAGPATLPWPVTRAAAVEDGLAIEWFGNDCLTFRPDASRVVESAEAVTLGLRLEDTTESWDCMGSDASTHRVVLPLEAPLGDRAVIDGGCRVAPLAGAPDCRDEAVPVSR